MVKSGIVNWRGCDYLLAIEGAILRVFARKCSS
jgi:hypothetical protein